MTKPKSFAHSAFPHRSTTTPKTVPFSPSDHKVSDDISAAPRLRKAKPTKEIAASIIARASEALQKPAQTLTWRDLQAFLSSPPPPAAEASTSVAARASHEAQKDAIVDMWLRGTHR